MRTLLPALLPIAFAFACEARPTDPRPCDTSAALSVSLAVTDASGAALPSATARWTAATGSDDCQRSGAELLCGWEVAGTMTIVVSAPGHATKTVQVAVPQGECHVVPQHQTVALERSWFEEERRYVQTYFATQEECTAAQPEGFFVNCCAWVLFGVDGRAEILVTDILNAGSYRLESGAIVFTRESPGDVPDTLRFTVGEDGAITDANGGTWRRQLSAGCY
jgi:hypothetical protein